MTNSELEPPAYEEAVAGTITPATLLPSSNLYISSRPAPGPAPPDTITYLVDLLSPKFPTPEAAWLDRDVRNEDWDTFVGQLHRPAAEKESEAQWRRRTDYVRSEWNDEFFAPRGCRIEIDAGAAEQQAESPAAASKEKKWGFNLPPASNSFGLRIGGSVLGIKWAEDEKKEDRKEDKK